MSARDDLINIFEGHPTEADHESIGEFIDAYAHELAEKIAEKIRAAKVPNPVGEAEEHVNYVLDDLANRIAPGREQE
ncbi:hypothetical protein [Streptomyces halobius]|uniref:Uncharacterized protein n=1 Tax=Streptomyces halobius TaxID=2879846 RepID=A0ABY4M340_9ACTN|nr:hypothetical protein [Streptomyces halobius]UQA91623.1 hypothetical protein K9S39_06910 [Streptomyces halobius]